MNRQIRSLAGAVCCEQPEAHASRIVEVGGGVTEKLPGSLRGRTGNPNTAYVYPPAPAIGEME